MLITDDLVSTFSVLEKKYLRGQVQETILARLGGFFRLSLRCIYEDSVFRLLSYSAITTDVRTLLSKVDTSTLILVKGALDARGSKLMPDKIDFGYSSPCDGPRRGGNCYISARDAFYLAKNYYQLNQ